jgi:hypothetical protein
MSKPKPSSVTAEEAVARMVNMDYIPEGFTLEEMLSAFKEEAEVEHYNAGIDRLPEEQIESLKVRLDACEARLSLAHLLLSDLREEVQKAQGSAIVRANDSSSKPRYTLESIADWVSYKYGIGIPEWSSDFVTPSASRDIPVDVTWEDIEIRIRKDNKIAFSHKDGKWTEKTFDEIGLFDKKNQAPNKQGGIMIGLSMGERFPVTPKAQAKDKTAISKLRKSLSKLTGIKRDPFKNINITDGWKPRFNLCDARDDADKRAEKAAKHVEFDDSRNYEDEYDDAG